MSSTLPVEQVKQEENDDDYDQIDVKQDQLSNSKSPAVNRGLERPVSHLTLRKEQLDDDDFVQVESNDRPQTAESLAAYGKPCLIFSIYIYIVIIRG
jgi:hypothetical protein